MNYDQKVKLRCSIFSGPREFSSFDKIKKKIADQDSIWREGDSYRDLRHQIIVGFSMLSMGFAISEGSALWIAA